MSITRRAALGALAGFAAAPSLVRAQGFPSRPVRLVVPYPAGGSVDVFARIVAAEMGPALGQNVIVENVGGASGSVGTRQVARAEADGHTLVLGTNQTHATNSVLLKEPGYDPVKDFVPVAGVADLQHALVVRNDLGVTDVASLIAKAKAEPGKLNYGSTGAGSASHLAMELLKTRAGIDMAHIPFRGAAPMAQELVAGRIDLAYSTLPSVLGQIQGGQMKAIAIASSIAAPQLPGVPTLKDAGVADAEADAWIAIFAPRATPEPAVAALGRAVLDALTKPEVRATITKQGIAPNPRDGATFASYLGTEIGKWSSVVAAAGVKPE